MTKSASFSINKLQQKNDNINLYRGMEINIKKQLNYFKVVIAEEWKFGRVGSVQWNDIFYHQPYRIVWLKLFACVALNNLNIFKLLWKAIS